MNFKNFMNLQTKPMLFDLTKNVTLEPRWQRYYLAARTVLWLVFSAFILYVSWIILFPTQTFSVELYGPGSDRDTFNNFSFSTSPLSFDAFSRENFSDVRIEFNQVSDREFLAGQEIKVRKSFQSFAYPESERPVGFPSGILVKDGGNYYIVSGGELRRFASKGIAESLGYTDDSFSPATAEELSYNSRGADITGAGTYPDDSLFLVSGTYYRLRAGKLHPFVSENAFRSFFEPEYAVVKDESFLNSYEISEDQEGFADGTLLSFDNAVFIVAEGNIMPFNHPDTFISFGLDWKDIIPAAAEEADIHEQESLFTIDKPLPDGTVFKTLESGRYFLVQGGKKWPIRGDNILKAYLKKSPILVNEKSLEFKNSCRMDEDELSFDSFGCSIPIGNLARYPGNDYRFETGLSSDDNIQSATITFSRDINWPNARDTLSKIKLRILNRYGYASLN